MDGMKKLLATSVPSGICCDCLTGCLIAVALLGILDQENDVYDEWVDRVASTLNFKL